MKEGVAIDKVLMAMTAALRGKEVYSDAPELDQNWLNRMVEKSGQSPPITIQDLGSALRPYKNLGEQSYILVHKLEPAKHRALSDVDRLRRLAWLCEPTLQHGMDCG